MQRPQMDVYSDYVITKERLHRPYYVRLGEEPGSSRETNQVAANTEPGTRACRAAKCRGISIEDDESTGTTKCDERYFVNPDLLLRDRVSSNRNDNALNEVLYQSSDECAHIEIRFHRLVCCHL